MARSKNNGQDRLEEAMALLIQDQAAFVASMRESDARMRELKADIAETNRLNAQRFARIEAILLEHGRILERLPDAVRDKIGFRPPTSPA
jgi:hypothetical protein